MTFAAAFSGPDTPPDISGCVGAPNAGDGSAIASPPVDGMYSVFAATDSGNTLFLGSSLLASFRAGGAILTAGLFPGQPQLTIPANTPLFELAGNVDAAPRPAKGAFTLRGTRFQQSRP